MKIKILITTLGFCLNSHASLHKNAPEGRHAEQGSTFEFSRDTHHESPAGELEIRAQFDQPLHLLKRDLSVGLALDILEESDLHEYHVGFHAAVDCIHYEIDFNTDLSSDFFTYSDWESEVDLTKKFNLSSSLKFVTALRVRYLENELSPGMQLTLVQNL